MDFERLEHALETPKRRMMLQRTIAVIAGLVIFGFIASTFDPDDSSASPSSASRQRGPSIAAGRAGDAAKRSPTASSPRVGTEPAHLETSGRIAPAHPRGLAPLGHMLGREYLTWIYTSPDGPRFTICRPDGHMLAEDLTADEVYTRFPDLDIKNMGMHMHAGGGPLMMAPEHE